MSLIMCIIVGVICYKVGKSRADKSLYEKGYEDGFDDGVEELLTKEAKDKNLFETDKDWDLELDKEIEKEISVIESNEQGVKIKLIAKSSVKPKVDKNKIVDDLKSILVIYRDWDTDRKSVV